MKTAAALTVSLLAAMAGSVHAHNTHHEPFFLSGRLNCPVISEAGGTYYLQISLKAPVIKSVTRKPMNLVIVLDRSGSMADEKKISHARSALYALVDQLTREDLLSIVIYDDIVEVLRPASRVREPAEVRALVERITPQGSTNLGGGLVEGLNQAVCVASPDYVNRVILLSDGLANQGITDPHLLNRIAAKYRPHSISVTTMGVGLDYNENLMVGIAESGGGNYYFIESASSIAHILRKEFESLTTILAQNAFLDIVIDRGVTVSDVIGYPWTQDGNRCRISLGDLASGHDREITMELRVSRGTGALDVARGTLEFEPLFPGVERPAGFHASARYSGHQGDIDQSRDHITQSKADIALSTRTVEKAMDSLDDGDVHGALNELEEAKAQLRSSVATAPPGAPAEALREQVGRLERFERILKDEKESRRAKKAIQYDNYRVQKNQE